MRLHAKYFPEFFIDRPKMDGRWMLGNCQCRGVPLIWIGASCIPV